LWGPEGEEGVETLGAKRFGVGKINKGSGETRFRPGYQGKSGGKGM